MTDIPFISFEHGDPLLNWQMVTDAITEGHHAPKAQIADSLLHRKDDTLLCRTAWVEGLGSAVKTATIHPGNAARGLPILNGAMMLFDDVTGVPEAVIDFHLVTKWKTAGDSLLGAKFLARPDSKRLLIVGAGTVSRSLVAAYSSQYDGLEIRIWNRSPANAADLVQQMSENYHISAVTDLPDAVAWADIICTATMATEPVIYGDWLRPGQHLDLIGAYTPDMREAGDTALARSRIYVDSRDTTLAHIGELQIPLATGVIMKSDVRGDFYDLVAGHVGRESASDITLFKNGGGAHLDLMTGKAILNAWRQR